MQNSSCVRVLLDETAIADYVYRDPVISRPYFANLHAPSGVKLTRNHPPVAGKDRMDHPDYHPGLWLAFGDLSGADNWRLKAPVVHQRFIDSPRVKHGVVQFQVENLYLDGSAAETLCHDHSRYTFRETPLGVLLTWDTTFSGDRPFWFGDQEEMGLGLRVATPLRVEQQGPDPAPPGVGEIVDNQGRKNAGQIWGQSPDWIDYRGLLRGGPAGVAIFCGPENFRSSRMHARDYGFVAANPFALAAFKAGEPSRVTINPGETLRLRYGLLLHAGRQLTQQDLDTAYLDYCRLAED